MENDIAPIDLTLLGRFKSPYFSSSFAELPCEWEFPYDDSNPWRPTSGPPGMLGYGGNDKLTITKTENCKGLVYMEDYLGNQYNILDDSSNIVDYYSQISTYTATNPSESNYGSTAYCVDFPWVKSYYYRVQVEFIGQGSENGITGIRVTREENPFSFGVLPWLGIKPYAKGPRSFLTARNGMITMESSNSFKILSAWDYTSTNYLDFGYSAGNGNAGFITNLRGYRTTDTSTTPYTYNYYGYIERNHYSPRTNKHEGITLCRVNFPLISSQ